MNPAPTSPSSMSSNGGRKRPSGQQRILQAGRQLFFRDSFQDVSIDAIVAEARVSKSTFYKHFDGKESLLSAVIDEESQRFAPNPKELESDVSARSLIQRFGVAFLRLILDPEIARFEQIVIAHAAHDPAIGDLFYGRAHLACYESLARIIQRGQQRGELDSARDAQQVAEDLICLWKHDYHARAQLSQLRQPPTRMSQHVQRCMDLVLPP